MFTPEIQERIAKAVESIAALEDRKVGYWEGMLAIQAAKANIDIKDVTVTVTETEKEPTTTAEEEDVVEGPSREEMLKILADRGVEVKAGTRTTTLVKMVADSEAPVVENVMTDAEVNVTADSAETTVEECPAEPMTQPAPVETPAAPVTPEVTLPDLSQVLRDVAAKKGADVLKGLIEAMGASSLSEVPAEKYAELMEKAKGELLI